MAKIYLIVVVLLLAGGGGAVWYSGLTHSAPQAPVAQKSSTSTPPAPAPAPKVAQDTSTPAPSAPAVPVPTTDSTPSPAPALQSSTTSTTDTSSQTATTQTTTTTSTDTSTPPTPPQTPSVAITWSNDSGARVSGSVPYIYKLSDGSYRLYYCGGGGILSAHSTDATSFSTDPGVRVAPGAMGTNEAMVCDATIVDLGGGKVRMYYKGATGPGGPGQATHKIYSAISPDGLSFTKEGVRIDSTTSGDNGWASVPEAYKLSDGRVRLYYVSNDPLAHGGIVSAISSDGLLFTREGVRVPGLVDPSVVRLPNGTYLMFVTSINPGPPGFLQNGIYMLTSADGLSFGNLTSVIKGIDVYDPSAVVLDDHTVRVYYGTGYQTSAPSVKSVTGIIK